MRQAVIVSYARSGLTPALHGAFRHTAARTLLGHTVRHAVGRAGVEPLEVEDLAAGCVTTPGNVARAAAALAGLPATTAGVTLHRAEASGLNAIAHAAQCIVTQGAGVAVAGGVDALRPGPGDWSPAQAALQPAAPRPDGTMARAADAVALRYEIGRGRQDLYALESRRRAAVAQADQLVRTEIVPLQAEAAGPGARSAARQPRTGPGEPGHLPGTGPFPREPGRPAAAVRPAGAGHRRQCGSAG